MIVRELWMFENCTQKYIKNNQFPIYNEGEENVENSQKMCE